MPQLVWNKAILARWAAALLLGVMAPAFAQQFSNGMCRGAGCSMYRTPAQDADERRQAQREAQEEEQAERAAARKKQLAEQAERRDAIEKRMAAEDRAQAAADRRAADKAAAVLAATKERCGDDYKSPRVGMHIERVKVCVTAVRLTAQINRADGVVSTYQGAGAYFHVMNGVVVSWGSY